MAKFIEISKTGWWSDTIKQHSSLSGKEVTVGVKICKSYHSDLHIQFITTSNKLDTMKVIKQVLNTHKLNNTLVASRAIMQLSMEEINVIIKALKLWKNSSAIMRMELNMKNLDMDGAQNWLSDVYIVPVEDGVYFIKGEAVYFNPYNEENKKLRIQLKDWADLVIDENNIRYIGR